MIRLISFFDALISSSFLFPCPLILLYASDYYLSFIRIFFKYTLIVILSCFLCFYFTFNLVGILGIFQNTGVSSGLDKPFYIWWRFNNTFVNSILVYNDHQDNHGNDILVQLNQLKNPSLLLTLIKITE